MSGGREVWSKVKEEEKAEAAGQVKQTTVIEKVL